MIDPDFVPAGIGLKNVYIDAELHGLAYIEGSSDLIIDGLIATTKTTNIPIAVLNSVNPTIMYIDTPGSRSSQYGVITFINCDSPRVYSNYIETCPGVGIYLKDSHSTAHVYDNEVSACVAGVYEKSQNDRVVLIGWNSIQHTTYPIAVDSVDGVAADYNSYIDFSSFWINGELVGFGDWREALGGCPGTGRDCGSVAAE